MSAEENKALVRHMIEELFGRGNLDVADEFFAADYVGHDPASPEEIRGPEGIKQYVAAMRAAFPDLQVTIEDQVAEGEKVATRYSATGTHQGDLEGILPTGQQMTIAGIALDSLEGGKIKEGRDSYDALGMMQQLGAIPAPEQTEA